MTYGPAGNTDDKFNAKNPISRALMRGFISTFQRLAAQIDARTVLEVGCGEGEIQRLLAGLSGARQLAFDIDLPIVQDASRKHSPSAYFVANGEHIPLQSKSVDAALAIEVLEHVPNPEKVLAEMKRVARHHIIVSVPREPIWRVLNIARGKYLSAVGNTPGHIQHWSSRGIVRVLERHFTVVAVERPLPWTMVLARIDD